jgi:hypothetical protein
MRLELTSVLGRAEVGEDSPPKKKFKDKVIARASQNFSAIFLTPPIIKKLLKVN